MTGTWNDKLGEAKIAFTRDAHDGTRTTCPVCGSSKSEPFLTVTDSPSQHLDLHMVRCQACGTGYFINENPVIGYDNDGFERDYWINYVQNGAGITAMLEPLLALDRPRSGRLLDVGCGFGFVPHFWTEMGYGEAIGLESSLYGRAGSEKLGVKIIPSYFNAATEIHGTKFDYVFSSEVIEHVENPHDFVNEIKAGLAEDGVLVLTTPSETVLTEDAPYVELLATLSPEFHYFVASRQGLEDLLKECGFAHVEVRDLGHRLYAWASHQPLPAIASTFADWDIYLDYLDRLTENADRHVAGGAQYRLFKDSLNLGFMERARKSFETFTKMARDDYGIAFDVMPDMTQGTSYADIPAWAGTGGYHVGKYLKLTGADGATQMPYFQVSAELMAWECERGKQFSGEANHFAPFAQKEIGALRLAQFKAKHGAKFDATPAYNLRLPPDLAGKDVCLVAIFAPDGRVTRATGTYLTMLRGAGFLPIACLAVSDIDANVSLDHLENAAGIFVRKNAGMDFAAWAAALRIYSDAWDARRLIFTNDSILVLPNLFPAFVKTLRAQKSAFVGLTESTQIQYHIQSYFFMLQGAALTDPRVQAFWADVQALENKKDIIRTYETKLHEVFHTMYGHDSSVLFGFERIFPGIEHRWIADVNPSIAYWERMIQHGMPFIKGELLRDKPMNLPIAHWPLVVAEHGANVADLKDHIAVPRPAPKAKKKRKHIKRKHHLYYGLGLWSKEKLEGY